MQPVESSTTDPNNNNGGGPEVVDLGAGESPSSSKVRKVGESSTNMEVDDVSTDDLRGQVTALLKEKEEWSKRIRFLERQVRGQEQNLSERVGERLGNARQLPRFEDKFTKGDDWNLHWTRFTQYCSMYESLTSKQKSVVLVQSIDKSIRGLTIMMGSKNTIPPVEEINRMMAKSCISNAANEDGLMRWQVLLQNFKQGNDEDLLEFVARIKSQWDAFRRSPEFLDTEEFITQHERILYVAVVNGVKKELRGKLQRITADWKSGNRKKPYPSDLQSMIEELLGLAQQTSRFDPVGQSK